MKSLILTTLLFFADPLFGYSCLNQVVGLECLEDYQGNHIEVGSSPD